MTKQIPDWRQNTGHAHPDANSFIIFANGKYLTGDTGYLGIKNTDDHNTVLINGRGQEKDGLYEMFKDVSNERLDKVRIAEVSENKEFLYVRGEAASGYYNDLGLQKFNRHFLYVSSGYFVIWDELQTEKTAEFTFLLNADKEINVDGVNAQIVNGNAALHVIRVLPQEAVSGVVPQMIQARGLPGSVSQGDLEQRGVQLQTVSVGKNDKFEFLHFLQPVLLSDQTAAPKLEQTVEGLKISWQNGDEDLIDLRGDIRSLELRRNGKILPKLILQGQMQQ